MKQTPTDADRERAALELWAELTSVTGAVRTRLEQRLDAELGVLPEEAELLVRLGEAPEQRLRMADVSRSLRLSKSGVTRLVDRLADRGLVVRAACPKDRRVVYAGLTDEGRRAAASAAPAVAAGVAEQLAGGLSAEQLDALTASLRATARTRRGRRLTAKRRPSLTPRSPRSTSWRPERNPSSSTPRRSTPGTDIGHVHLKVSDLDRALAFYQGVLGFALTGRLGDQAAFVSAGGYHHHIGLNTWESRGGSPPPRGRPASTTWPSATRRGRRWRARCAR